MGDLQILRNRFGMVDVYLLHLFGNKAQKGVGEMSGDNIIEVRDMEEIA
jgi:hypothetical protein